MTYFIHTCSVHVRILSFLPFYQLPILLPRMLSRVPLNEKEWEKLALLNHVANRSIHQTKLQSASKIGGKQYLLLRVLWNIASENEQLNIADKFGLSNWMREATNLLTSYKSWKAYCESFHQGQILEGTFALPKFYQEQAASISSSIENSNNLNIVFTPISKRTCAQTQKTTEAFKRLVLETPTKPSKRPVQELKLELSDEEELFFDEDGLELGHESAEETETPPGQRSYGPSELVNVMFPKTKDEQIVNTALIDFLNAFIIHRKLPVQWTLHRRPFKAIFQDTAYKARTDGCLEDTGPQGKVYALVEVKPAMRGAKRVPSIPIAMQEAAQMVAWIKSDPDPSDFKHSCGQ